MQCLWLDPRMALAVLTRLAAYQATDFDPESDAEPGKILHEMRAGEMATLHEIPFGLYYGSVDSTPLFVILAGRYAQATGDLDTLRSLWPAIERALGWIDGPGDRDHDGFVEYFKATPRGLSNQGWKDSYDSVFHADGRLAEGPIALAEVQGYVYAAKKLASWCANQLGFTERAHQLDTEADQLAERFEDAYLVRGDRDLCARSRWRQEALPGGDFERWPSLVQRNCPQRPRRTDRATPHGAELLLWLGGADRGRRRGPLQSDVLSQWLRVAP